MLRVAAHRTGVFCAMAERKSRAEMNELLTNRLKQLSHEACGVVFGNRIRYYRHLYAHDALCKVTKENPNDKLLHCLIPKIAHKSRYGFKQQIRHQYLADTNSKDAGSTRAINLCYHNELNFCKQLPQTDTSLVDAAIICSAGMQPGSRWCLDSGRGGHVGFEQQRLAKMYIRRQRSVKQFIRRVRRKCYKNANSEAVGTMTVLMNGSNFFAMYDMFALLPMQSHCVDGYDEDTSSNSSFRSDDEQDDGDIDMQEDNLLLEQMNLYLWRQRQRNCRQLYTPAHYF